MFKRIARNHEYNHSKYVCLSTTTKPTTGIEFGDVCLEINTGNVFAFNGSSWVQQASLVFTI